MKFLDGLDNDIKANLLAQLRNLWTHTSTALEGNTLTLGETAFVIEEGLTVSGKPLKDHEEVAGHAKAIEIVYEIVTQAQALSANQLLKLHQAVQTERVADIYKPIGGWKVEPNGTYVVTDDERQVYLEYATPADTPCLMDRWIEFFNDSSNGELNQEEALTVYSELHISFVRIHPFFDGNGRVARLVANVPVITSGYPPIVISNTKRREYIRLLSHYELIVGQPRIEEPLVPKKELMSEFEDFCRTEWAQSLNLVEKARQQQKIRDAANSETRGQTP